jgi:ABC-type branched-subunit amino acid transport system substrate-binding protein
MPRSYDRNITVFVGTALLCLLLSASGMAQLTPAQAAGKKIFTEGISPSGKPIEAILGEGSTRVPGNLMLCASCHGFDGKGRPEGGITPSIITWNALTSALRSKDAMGRRRSAYTVPSLRRAITRGVDPLGKGLGVTMPRYELSPRDFNNLVEYLKVLGSEYEPGLTSASIRLGTIIPAGGPLAVVGERSAALLKAYFDELNHQGGIYGRRLEVFVMKASGAPAEIERQAEEFVRKNNIFAIAGILAPNDETGVTDAMERLGVPTIGAFASNSESDSSSRLKTFYLLSGLSQEARVLVKFAGEQAKSPAEKIAVVFPESMANLASLVTEQCHSLAMENVTSLKYSEFDGAKLASSLSQQNITTVFFLGRGSELADLLAGAPALHWTPTVFQPGPLAGEEVLKIAASFADHVFLSFPTLPTDLEAEAMEEYRRLAAKYHLDPVQPARLLAVLASAKVLTEGLRQSGQQLGRERFVVALSKMYGFQTGLTPPISYSATRRIGALGAYVVKLDLKNKTFAPVDSWIAP